MLILNCTSPDSLINIIALESKSVTNQCIALAGTVGGAFRMKIRKGNKENRKCMQTRYKNMKRIHTWNKFFLKKTTNYIPPSLYYFPFMQKYCTQLHHYFAVLPSSLKMVQYNMRLLLSDSTQVQSGMLLVRNGICSKFHCIPQAALNVVGSPPAPAPVFCAPPPQLVLTAKSNHGVSY